MKYSDGFKKNMVQKMLGRDAVSATALAKSSGVPQATLSKWLRQAAASAGTYATDTARRPQDWPLEEKLSAIIEIDRLPEGQVGPFLRKMGVCEGQVRQWRKAVTAALGAGELRKTRVKAKGERARIKELEKELRRKDKALAETAALLVLKKKAAAIWGDGDDVTYPRKG